MVFIRGATVQVQLNPNLRVLLLLPRPRLLHNLLLLLLLPLDGL